MKYSLHKLSALLAHAMIHQFTFKMADIQSVEYAKQVAVPPTLLEPTEQKGKIRIAHFDLGTVDATAADTLSLAKLPAGKIRITRVALKHAAWTATSTLALGLGAYTEGATKEAVAADADAILAATAMDNVTQIDSLVDLAFNSLAGVTLTGLVGVADSGAAATTGWIEYVQE
jgi:hypothetical protein